MTNFEWIKNMSVETLSNKLPSIVRECESCPIHNFCNKNSSTVASIGRCRRIWSKWLKSERK